MSLNTAGQKRSRPSFACIVLGAGAGTRFGKPKASATLPDGTTFLERVVSTARECGADPVVVVSSHARSEVPGTVNVVNPDPFSPQIRSLRFGLSRLVNTDVEGALVWPVDCPFVQAATVQALLSATTENARIAVPNYEGRNGHPTWFAREVWPELMTAEGDGARTVVRRDATRVARVAVEDHGVLADIDTREDLDRELRNQAETRT